MSKKTYQERTNQIKNFFSNPYNLALVVVLVLTFALRLYYLYLTRDQAVWWDEGEYLSHAKKIAFGVPYDINPQRPPLFQYLLALFMALGFSEVWIKFFLVTLPSAALVFSIYLLGKEMFSERVGLIAALFASVSWSFLFWSARFQPDFFSMTFQVFSIYYMWKYWKSDKKTTLPIILSSAFAALAFYFKVSALLVPMSFMLFMLIKDRFSMFKNKHYWIFALVYVLAFIPYFIWSGVTFGTITAFTSGYVQPVAAGTPFGWYNINFYYTLTTGIVFALFIVGLLYGLKFILYLDILVKDKKKCFDSNVFSILMLVLISAFYIFHIKNTDDRWVFLWMPFIFYLAGNATVLVYETLRKYHKIIALILIFAIVARGVYDQYGHADSLIKLKMSSYAPVREAGLWIKQNSNPEDKVMSISYTQTVYYTERNVTSYSLLKNGSDLTKFAKENHPRFLEVSLFEPHPDWIFRQGQQNGYSIMALPFFNSSVIIKDGQAVQIDIKPEVKEDGVTYTLVYPLNQLNGMFVYELTYEA